MLGGAVAGGFARTLLRSADDSQESIFKRVSFILRDLKIAMFLTGQTRPYGLRRVKYFVLEPLRSWMEAV